VRARLILVVAVALVAFACAAPPSTPFQGQGLPASTVRASARPTASPSASPTQFVLPAYRDFAKHALEMIDTYDQIHPSATSGVSEWKALQTATTSDLQWLVECYSTPCVNALSTRWGRAYRDQVSALSDLAQGYLDWLRGWDYEPVLPLDDPWDELDALEVELRTLANG
jgi:hypothetical protein